MIPTPKLSPGCSRIVPLPNFSWASAKDVWSALLQREQRYGRNPLMMSRHPSLQPRMRSILLNWLSEVSEVYQLHRETYYLAVDFFDRYLSVQSNIPKQQLQLIGVTCLFMASKMEEIYPPKVKDFAYVTDGACTVEQIITKELVILRCLKWKLSSLTVNSWLTIYMQLYAVLEKEPRSDRLPVATPSSPTSTTTVTASSEDVVESSSCKLDKATSSAGDKDELNAESIDKFAASAPPKKRKRIVLNNSTQLDANENNVTAGSTSASTQINSTSNNTCSNTAEVLIDKSNAKSESSSVQSDASIDSAVHSVTTTTGTTRRCTKKDFISSILGRESEEAGEKFMRQRFSPYFFAQVAHLLDLSMLDIGSLRFSYNVISAAALYHFTNLNTVLQCTGLKLEQIQECIMWMTPFALAIRDEGFEQLKIHKSPAEDESDSQSTNIQTHTVDLKLLEKAQMKTQQQQVLTERNVSSVNAPSSPASMPPAAPQSSSIGSTAPEMVGSSSPLKSPMPSTSHILTPPRSHSKQTTPV